MRVRKKIYFISDIHLGAPALDNNREREQMFVKWMDEVKKDAEEVFLMGDIFDFWFEYKKVVPRGFTRTLGKIAELTDLGIKVHFFTGNHDVWVFDYLPEELGVILHKEAYRAELKGKNFFLAHGDGLDPGDKGYNLLKRIFVNKFLQWCFARLHPNLAVTIGHKWSQNSRLSKNISGDHFVPEKEGLFIFAEKILGAERFDYFIFGHRHIFLKIPIGNNGAQFVLLGDWINEFSYGVFDGEKFELKKYSKDS